jgi:hypothetical protein
VTAPGPVVFLHIGAMKTGTTFLQNLMHKNKENLAASGYLLPGERWVHEVRAVQDVLGGGPGYPAAAPNTAGEWAALARRMVEHDGPASILSMEFLSLADPRRARRVLRSLEPAEVHVILTVRDATSTIQAQWQTTVRNNSRVSWTDFMKGIRRAGGIEGRFGRLSWNRALRSFMRAQDTRYMLETWCRYLPPERVHVITVPSGSDRTLLWERFAGVVGLDPGVCSELPEEANESLGYASTELIRRINIELGRLPHTEYNPTILDYLAIPVLAGRRDEENTARIDRTTFEFGLSWNRRVREAILAAGVDLVGDLDELPVTDGDMEPEIDDHQAPPSDDEILAAATVADEAMRRLITRRVRRLRRQGEAADTDNTADVETVGPESWLHTSDPVAAAVKDIAALSRRAIGLNNRLRELRLRTSR